MHTAAPPPTFKTTPLQNFGQNSSRRERRQLGIIKGKLNKILDAPQRGVERTKAFLAFAKPSTLHIFVCNVMQGWRVAGGLLVPGDRWELRIDWGAP